MDAAEAQDLYDLAVAGRAAARRHQPDAEKPVEERYPDVLAALQWHLDRGEIEAGFRLANALVTFWMGTNPIPDGDDWFDRLLAAPAEADGTRALALHEHGYLVFWAGEHDRADQRFHECLDLATALEDASLQALALAGLARVALYTDPAEAVRLLRRALDLAHDLPDDDPGKGSAVHVLGPALQMCGDLEGARDVIGQRLATARRQGVAFVVWSESSNLSMVERQLGHLDRAEELSRQAIDTATAREHDLYLSWALNGLAAVTAAKGDPRRSATLLGAADSLIQHAGGEWPPDEREQYDETEAALRQAVPPDELADARAHGTAMTREQAVAYALSQARPRAPLRDREDPTCPGRSSQPRTLRARRSTVKGSKPDRTYSSLERPASTPEPERWQAPRSNPRRARH